MNVKTVYKISLPSVEDNRGILTSIEQFKDITFNIKRIFYMHHINGDRGGHAHIDTDQVIIALYGSFKLKVFDGIHEDIYLLNNCMEGIFTPRLTFCDMYDFSLDAVCLVISNTHYEKKMSLRSKNEYLNYIQSNKNE